MISQPFIALKQKEMYTQCYLVLRNLGCLQQMAYAGPYRHTTKPQGAKMCS